MLKGLISAVDATKILQGKIAVTFENMVGFVRQNQKLHSFES